MVSRSSLQAFGHALRTFTRTRKILCIDLTIRVFLWPNPNNICSQATQNTPETRATSVQTPFWATVQKLFFVACTVPIATKYAEPRHSWSVLHRTLRRVPRSWRPPLDADGILSIGSLHLRDFIDQDTVRQPPTCHTSTRHVQSLQKRLNDFVVQL